MNTHTYVIDNDPILLFLMKRLMLRTDFDTDIRFYENGENAIETLKQEYKRDELFVIFLDINMPEMSGWEFLDELDIFTKPDNTLVFMISSSINRSDMEKANAHKHISKFLVKPIEESVLMELKAHVERQANL